MPRAVATAWRPLLQLHAEDPRSGRHWHLARIYLGPGGGGALIDSDGDRRLAIEEPDQNWLDPDRSLIPAVALRLPCPTTKPFADKPNCFEST